MQNMQNMQNNRKLNLPNQTFQTKPTKPNLPNQTYQTNPTKPNLPNQTKPNLPKKTYQTEPTKPTQTYQPNLPIQTYQTKSSKPNLPNQIKLSLPNQNYWSKQSTPGSVVPLAMFRRCGYPVIFCTCAQKVPKIAKQAQSGSKRAQITKMPLSNNRLVAKTGQNFIETYRIVQGFPSNSTIFTWAAYTPGFRQSSATCTNLPPSTGRGLARGGGGHFGGNVLISWIFFENVYVCKSTCSRDWWREGERRQRQWVRGRGGKVGHFRSPPCSWWLYHNWDLARATRSEESITSMPLLLKGLSVQEL